MPEAKVKKNKHIFLFLRIAVVAVGIAWVASRIGQEQRWGSFLEYFHRMNVWIFAAILGICALGHAIVGLRWWLLLRTQSIFIKLSAAVKLYFLGWFYNNFMPGSVGGDIVRAWYVTKHTDKKFEAVLSVFVDRAIGLLSTLVIAAFFYLLFLQGRQLGITSDEHGGFRETAAQYNGLLLGILVVVMVVFCGLLIYKKTRLMLKKAWSLVCLHAMKMITKLRNAAVIYCSKPLVILVAFGLTVSVQIMVITGFWLLGASMGISADLKYYYIFFTLTWVLGSVPVSIGGVVVVEGALVILFTQFAGIDESAAWAIALCQRFVWMLTSLPGAVIHLAGAHLPKDFSIDCNKPVT